MKPHGLCSANVSKYVYTKCLFSSADSLYRNYFSEWMVKTGCSVFMLIFFLGGGGISMLNMNFSFKFKA